ncbi:hypothetical protein BCR37DRAFT_384163 [Protomyces lactucae-debilis]|uniref:Uncharacterized protein n=1 Tax=Protomyces lactucae-debilis TaxID=2754530 RepID=A0A1Y2EU71_PROLT|nr:uncharacterized protein BCR37DRAFT_384159 [Protomyces lactucae-debilis]XP_040722223.1 uncharacterized protein BCR37DRAFT_384161 [Protomyces lactucae-debilis]XP_040722224.1 uncharacterized protein BCR37DRAFT_384163 [Protomyces lactucae-debilis]ORY75110.1 hypothetical protein BCR37DRAFT_384159 [Protomyces lactucae-debilis]ORY75111.1 hypothetical protein BCR37DRAFT_384161 [Protomyces lactucae-debilis]ORY75112.1 hypothetical protein BCR37DRAFT_384163 [Protomyces lactucae-debilis]
MADRNEIHGLDCATKMPAGCLSSRRCCRGGRSGLRLSLTRWLCGTHSRQSHSTLQLRYS